MGEERTCDGCKKHVTPRERMIRGEINSNPRLFCEACSKHYDEYKREMLKALGRADEFLRAEEARIDAEFWIRVRNKEGVLHG